MRGIGKVLVLAGVSLGPVTGSVAVAGAGYLDPYTETLSHLQHADPDGSYFDVILIEAPTDRPCPSPITLGEAGGPAIVVPDDGRFVRILLETRPAALPPISALQITDACAGFDGPDDGATLRLPENDAGYAALAWLHGMPWDDGIARVFDPELGYVPSHDPDGRSWLFLGVVNPEGVFTASDQAFASSAGVATPRDITPLFLWTGVICYPSALPEGLADIPGTAYADECCEVTDDDGDGRPDRLESCGLETWSEAAQDDACATASLPCVSYSAAETWLFSVPDVADALWDADRQGGKTVRLRFFPLPLKAGGWVQNGE